MDFFDDDYEDYENYNRNRPINLKVASVPSPRVDTVKVYEYKAPTDESVRLLNEMEEKARQNIIDQVEVKNTIIHAIAFATTNRIVIDATDRVFIYIKFKINGEEVVIKDIVSGNDYALSPFVGRVNKLIVNKLVELLGVQLLKIIENH